MKPPILLKTILDIAFYLLIAGIFFSIFFVVLIMLNSETFFIPINIDGAEITEYTPSTIFLMLISMSFFVLFIFLVYYLRKLVRNFLKQDIFSKGQVKYLNRIGNLIIGISVGKVVIDLLKNLFLENEISFGIEIGGDFGSFWFTLALGLFFIFLSQVFEKARLLKEDNDLTV